MTSAGLRRTASTAGLSPPPRLSASVERALASPAPTVTGDVTIAGTTRPVPLQLAVHDGAGTVRFSGSTHIVQSDFGIKPFSAFLGALKVKDTVELAVDVSLPR